MPSGALDDRVRLAVLCDYALTSEDGKVSAIGLFSNIGFASLPANYPRFFVLIVMSLDAGQHEANVSLFGPNGAEIIPNGPAMQLDVPDGSHETNLIIGFDNLTFNLAGAHHLQLRLNGQPAVAIPFNVSAAAEQQAFTARGNA